MRKRKPFIFYGGLGACMLIAGAAVLVLPVFFPGRERGARTHHVAFTEEGFVPEEVSIRKGDTVVFITTRAAPFWPASNLHPTHIMYPEFDPRRALDPGETWSFTFEKEGTWKYHDHRAPLYRGVITVYGEPPGPEFGVEGPVEAVFEGAGQASHILQPETPCENGGGEFACWEYRVDRALKEKGLDGAFETIAVLSGAYPSFAKDCHEFGHRIGEAAYFEYSKTRDIPLTSKTSYCGYGFYHGFMETLLQATGDIDVAREFCVDAGKKITAEIPDAEAECYHGIGHGAVDGSDPGSLGNAQAMISPALEICESVSVNASHLRNCFSGVFNALANFALSGERDVGFAA